MTGWQQIFLDVVVRLFWFIGPAVTLHVLYRNPIRKTEEMAIDSYVETVSEYNEEMEGTDMLEHANSIVESYSKIDLIRQTQWYNQLMPKIVLIAAVSFNIGYLFEENILPQNLGESLIGTPASTSFYYVFLAVIIVALFVLTRIVLRFGFPPEYPENTVESLSTTNVELRDYELESTSTGDSNDTGDQ